MSYIYMRAVIHRSSNLNKNWNLCQDLLIRTNYLSSKNHKAPRRINLLKAVWWFCHWDKRTAYSSLNLPPSSSSSTTPPPPLSLLLFFICTNRLYLTISRFRQKFRWVEQKAQKCTLLKSLNRIMSNELKYTEESSMLAWNYSPHPSQPNWYFFVHQITSKLSHRTC